jgi:hypothetical protein
VAIVTASGPGSTKPSVRRRRAWVVILLRAASLPRGRFGLAVVAS